LVAGVRVRWGKPELDFVTKFFAGYGQKYSRVGWLKKIACDVTVTPSWRRRPSSIFVK